MHVVFLHLSNTVPAEIPCCVLRGLSTLRIVVVVAAAAAAVGVVAVVAGNDIVPLIVLISGVFQQGTLRQQSHQPTRVCL